MGGQGGGQGAGEMEAQPMKRNFGKCVGVNIF